MHTRKVGLTAFDTKRWLCKDTVHTHSHGHKDTVPDPMYLVNRSFIIRCIVGAGVFTRKDLPGISLRQERLESDSDSDLESDPDSDPPQSLLKLFHWMDSQKTVFVVHLLIGKLFM